MFIICSIQVRYENVWAPEWVAYYTTKTRGQLTEYEFDDDEWLVGIRGEKGKLIDEKGEYRGELIDQLVPVTTKRQWELEESSGGGEYEILVGNQHVVYFKGYSYNGHVSGLEVYYADCDGKITRNSVCIVNIEVRWWEMV